MIRIERAQDCVGCSACADICPSKAIALSADSEGFQYPEVNRDLCTNCGLCEKTCPQLHPDDLTPGYRVEPIVYAAYHKDQEVRRESTSGGLFSALANEMYDRGGYVGGVVYTPELTARHIVSKNREDLARVRGSKYFQSDMTGVFKQVETLLKDGHSVLVCGAPCQMAGLRLFLRKEYERLVTVDFICLGIASPRIFHRYLESLERQYGSRVVSIQAKNKDLGWRSLGCKVMLADGRTYVRNGQDDDFVRGFVQAHCYFRPACYECKYKGFPRVSDITLGDFWGIEDIERSMDDNMGTSAVLLHTQKGIAYFEAIKDKIVSKQVTLDDVTRKNPALTTPVDPPAIDRGQYYKDVRELPFETVAKKYHPSNESPFGKIKKRLGSIRHMLRQMGYGPRPYVQLLWMNVLRRNTQSKPRRGWLIFPARHVVMNIDKDAQISVEGTMLIGFKKIRGSRMETRMALEGSGALRVEGGSVAIYYGTEMQVFDGGQLTFAGNATINQHVQIVCMDRITIGKDVIIARDVVIRDNDGGHAIVAEGYRKAAPVTIGNHVWIGQGAMIMKGVTIGDGAVIGAGAWVAKDVKPNSLVLGDPARAVQKDIRWKP